MALKSPTSEPEPDMSLINELYEEIERKPPGIEARKLLIQTLIAAGWSEAAHDAAKELLGLKPRDSDVKSWLKNLNQPPSLVAAPSPQASLATIATPPMPKDMVTGKQKSPHDYASLINQARSLFRGKRLLRSTTQSKNGSDNESSVLKALGNWFSGNEEKDDATSARFERHIPIAVANGQLSTVVQAQPHPSDSARSVACAMEERPDQAVDSAFKDLEGMASRLRNQTASPVSDDDVREALMKRVGTLAAVLPEGLKIHAATALMHIEHEVLRRSYIISETMYGDLVADIPRSNFLVTQDGYPWDLDELAQAIQSNGGVFRNPLSRQIFTTDDVTAIISHPLGKRLAAMEIEQKRLKQGVRPKTIEELDKLAAALLADQSSDQLASRHAMDTFMAFLATLPVAEQIALDKLRVPATDSHTGQKFDSSIGEAVRDAKGNRICFHKAGDLFRQAVAYLER